MAKGKSKPAKPADDELENEEVAEVENEDAGEVEDSGAVETEVADTEVEQPQPSWREKFGYQDVDDDKAVELLQQQLAERNQLQQQWQQAQSEMAEMRRLNLWQHNQQQEAQQKAAREQAEAAKQPAKPKFAPAPEYDPIWHSLVAQDPETKEWRSINGAQPDLPQKIMAYARWKEADEQARIKDYAGYTWERIEDRVSSTFDQRFDERIAQMQQQAAKDRQQQEVQAWEKEHESWLYTGKKDLQGQPEFTPAGHWVAQRAIQLRQQVGVKSDKQALQIARNDLKLVIAEQKLAQQQAGTAATAANDKIKEDTLRKGATRSPNRDGAQTRDGKKHLKPDGTIDFEQLALSRFEEIGQGRHDRLELTR